LLRFAAIDAAVIAATLSSLLLDVILRLIFLLDFPLFSPDAADYFAIFSSLRFTPLSPLLPLCAFRRYATMIGFHFHCWPLSLLLLFHYAISPRLSIRCFIDMLMPRCFHARCFSPRAAI